MNDTPMQLTLRELQALCSSHRFWIGLAAVTIILAIAGPFRTLVELGFAERLVYWAVSSGLTFFCGFTVSSVAGLFFLQSGMPEWPARIAGGAIAGLPVAIIVWIINQYGFGMDMGGGAVFLRVWSYCTIISISIMILYVLLRGSETAETTTSPFLQRLPKHLGKNLLHLSAQDHYVEAVTENGSHLILMRFSDAIKELNNTDGIQIHRAHWVSLQAIKKPVRKENKLLIETTDGKRFPVSRSHSKHVKAVLKI